MKFAIALFGLLALSACGVDGEPVQPTANANISVSPSGVYTNVGLGLSQGPLSIYLGT